MHVPLHSTAPVFALAVLVAGCDGRATGPTTGSMVVAVTTEGVANDFDPDGYLLSVDDGAGLPIGIDTTVSMPNLPLGARQVRLAGMASNCSVDANPRNITIGPDHQPSTPLRISFAVWCAPRTGTIRVTTSTSGVALDSDGYVVALISGFGTSSSTHIESNGSATLSMRYGVHKVSLSGIVPNCHAVTPNPSEVTVVADVQSEFTFELTCATPTPLAFVEGEAARAEIYTIRSNGGPAVRLTQNSHADDHPAWSPDGTRIAFVSERDGNLELYVMRADGLNQTRLTSVPARDHSPAWSPDGTRIAFVSERDGNAEIYVMNADGTGTTRLSTHAAQDAHPSWSPDGSRIAFQSNRSDSTHTIWVMDPTGANLTQLTTKTIADGQPAWSPDGRRIVFVRALSHQGAAIMIMNVDGSEITRLSDVHNQVAKPAWSPDGHKIAYELVNTDFYYGYHWSDIKIISPTGIEYAPVTKTGVRAPAWGP